MAFTHTGAAVVPTPDPTPAEIRLRCAEIQATWDAIEEMKRRGIIRQAREVEDDGLVEIPRVSWRDVDFSGLFG